MELKLSADERACKKEIYIKGFNEWCSHLVVLMRLLCWVFLNSLNARGGNFYR